LGKEIKGMHSQLDEEAYLAYEKWNGLSKHDISEKPKRQILFTDDFDSCKHLYPEE
jgi:hypothetical protein